MTPPRWYHAPLYLWALPVTLLGLVLSIFMVPTEIRWNDGCLEIVPIWIPFSPGAQTWGWLILYCHHNAMTRDAGLRIHERVHVWQNLVGGVFFALAYVADFLRQYFLVLVEDPDCQVEPIGERRWFRAYMGICFEKTAYAIQNDYLAGNRPAAWGSL